MSSKLKVATPNAIGVRIAMTIPPQPIKCRGMNVTARIRAGMMII